jgi:2-desacetyl-2-hydroxyethyl bacteriochlorophyllide A dehydrogenase
MGYRGVPGHEFVGVVQQSSDTGVIGRRVVGEINAACGRCDFCRSGLGRHCSERTVLGILGRDGAFADYLTLPDRNLIPLPDSIPDDVAVLVEPVAAACEIFEQVRLGRDEKILVLGDGRLGAIVASVLRANSYAPVVGGHHPEKLAILAQLGLKVDAEDGLQPGFDCVIDCTGRPAGFTRAIELVRPRGRIILKSTAAANLAINLAPVVVNEITVTGSRCGRFGPAIELLEAGKIDLQQLISRRYPLDDAIAAFDDARDPLNFKILLQAS